MYTVTNPKLAADLNLVLITFADMTLNVYWREIHFISVTHSECRDNVSPNRVLSEYRWAQQGINKKN